MNFIEAVNSGKRFKRKSHDFWIEEKDTNEYGVTFMAIFSEYENCEDELLQLDSDDINATDYIIEEKVITITESEFYESIERVNCRNSHKSMTCDVEDLKKELGF